MSKKYTILMTSMGLEIGGAETHVVELSKELVKMGYRVIVASNGGVYVKELEESGIRHYNVPMHKRNILKMVISYYKLKKIIRREHVDIVHSHARIPGFICGFLHKKLPFTFVSTTHGVYSTKMGLKYLTNWGQKVIAVSDDIKDYLIKNYGIQEKDIYPTINGINTELFSPDADGSSIRREFKLCGNNIIAHVSRIDEKSSTVAKLLIRASGKICEKIPDAEIMIVGGGDDFESVKAEAAKANKKLGRRCIILTGPRTDVYKIIAVSRVVIGVSRAALEAMAELKPVILAGNPHYAQGYMGIFQEGMLEEARESNFCCRGCRMADSGLMARDVIKVLTELTPKEIHALGTYGRSVILEHYSVRKMTEDCIRAYDAAYKESKGKPYDVLMSGYYGFNNSGDEAILLAIHDNIEKMGDNINISVLSNNPRETRAKYGIEDVVYRFSLTDVIRAIRKCDVLISGGGSLLQDSTSTRSLMYYLSIIVAAKFFRKKIMLYANGIGPVSKKLNRRIVKLVVNKADLITLREENSFEELRSMGVKNKNAFVTADPVFTMDGISREKAMAIMEKQGIPTDKPIAGVSVRNWKKIDGFVDDFARLCDEVYEKYNRNIVFIVMHVPNDITISEIVQKKMKHPSYILKEAYSPYEVMGIISCMDFVLSMRLHTLIFAARQKVPLVGFIYDPKIEYYIEKLCMPSGGRVEDFDINVAMEKVDDVVKNREKYVEILDGAVCELEKKAHDNERYLLGLLKK